MEFRPFYMAREWVRAGHKVQILAASYSHIRANQPLAIQKLGNEQIEGVSYRWYSTPTYQGNGLSRVRNMLSFIWQIWKNAKQVAHEFKPDVVIASSTYPMDIWPAKRLAKISNAKLIFEVHDLWPLSPMELGGMSKWHPFIIWVQIAEDYAYRHADKVVSMLPKALSYMQSRGLDAKKFYYVPNGVDETDWVNPSMLDKHMQQRINMLRKQNLPLIGYAGTLGLANALDNLLDASKLLLGKANIVIIGTGPEKNRLEMRVQNENISNVFIWDSINKNAIPSFLSEIDIAYIGLLPEPLFRFGISPNKLMDYMMSSKPIVMSVHAGNDPVFDAKCGITVEPNQPDAVVNAVIEILSLPVEKRTEMGRRGRAFILKNQTYRVLAKKFIDLIGS